jgi:multiple sugar transport system substrate-binding protein
MSYRYYFGSCTIILIMLLFNIEKKECNCAEGAGGKVLIPYFCTAICPDNNQTHGKPLFLTVFDSSYPGLSNRSALMRAVLRCAFALLISLAVSLVACSDNQKRPIRVAINAGPEGDAIREVVKEYSDKVYPIELISFAYSSLREQLISALSRNEDKFDVVMIDDPWFPQLASNLRTLENVPDVLLQDIVEKSLSLGKEPYGTGLLKALPYVGNTQLLFLRSDIMSNHNVTDAPETWDEVVILTRQLTSPSDNRYGYAIRGRSGAPIVTDFLPIYWSLGGVLTGVENNKRVSKLETKIFRKALEIYSELEQTSPPGAINFDWSEMTAAFTNGRALMQLNWPAAIPDIENALKSGGRSGHWKIVLPPKGSSTAQGTSMIGNWLLAIPNSSKNATEAQKFVLWLMDQQGRVANEGRPPTRKSVFAALSQAKPYFEEIQRALELSTPRDRTEKWSQIEEAVSRAVNGYLVQAENIDTILKSIETDLNRILN